MGTCQRVAWDVKCNCMKNRILIGLISLLCFISYNSIACSCIGQRTIQEEIRNSDVLVVGTILNKEILQLTDSTMLKLFPNDTTLSTSPLSRMVIARYNLLVLDIYKGKITKDTITIFTGLGGGDCGFRFENGKKYIIYGDKETYYGQMNNDFNFTKTRNVYWTNICTRTTSYFQSEIDEIDKFVNKKKKR